MLKFLQSSRAVLLPLLAALVLAACVDSPTVNGIKVTVACSQGEDKKVHYYWHGSVASVADHYGYQGRDYNDTDPHSSGYVRESWKPSRDGEIQNGYQQVTLVVDMPNTSLVDSAQEWSLTKRFAVTSQCNATFT